METEGSHPHSQEPMSGPYPEPVTVNKTVLNGYVESEYNLLKIGQRNTNFWLLKFVSNI
jgi:hypothetical protein